MATYSLDFGNLDPNVFFSIKEQRNHNDPGELAHLPGRVGPPLKESSDTYKLSHHDCFAFDVFKPVDFRRYFNT